MIWIRGDGNARIGVGHLMRCMTIAEELALLQGGRENIRFVCADGESGAFVRENGFQSCVLGTDYRDMESELALWEGKLEGNGEGNPEGSVIIVDSYYVTDRYLAALGKGAYTILMDDMGTHRYPVDCVVNYNAQADPEEYERLYRGSNTRLLTGSRYVLLRQQFRNAQPWGGEKEPREVLITTGGGDVDNIGGKILERIYREEISFHLVTGRFHPKLREMKELEREHDNIHIHHDVRNMAALMERCQIALTAGGSTIYELSALGVPFICFSYAENQEALVEYIGQRQIAAFAGAWHRDPSGTLDRIERLFEEMMRNPQLRTHCSIREKEMTDGEGAVRLARVVMEAEGSAVRRLQHTGG